MAARDYFMTFYVFLNLKVVLDILKGRGLVKSEPGGRMLESLKLSSIQASRP
jgi:hypothetical protein